MTTDETPRRDPQPSSCPNETDQNVSQFELGERLGKLDAGQRHLLQFAIAIFAATVTVSVVVLSDMSNDIDQMRHPIILMIYLDKCKAQLVD